MNLKNNKISISKLSDDMVLRIIHEEFMRIKPKNYKEFYEKSFQFLLSKKGLV